MIKTVIGLLNNTAIVIVTYSIILQQNYCHFGNYTAAAITTTLHLYCSSNYCHFGNYTATAINATIEKRQQESLPLIQYY